MLSFLAPCDILMVVHHNVTGITLQSPGLVTLIYIHNMRLQVAYRASLNASIPLSHLSHGSYFYSLVLKLRTICIRLLQNLKGCSILDGCMIYMTALPGVHCALFFNHLTTLFLLYILTGLIL